MVADITIFGPQTVRANATYAIRNTAFYRYSLHSWLRMPEMVVATDAALGFGQDGKLLPWDADYTKYAGHPRTAGANAKVLRLGREQGVPAMFALSQLSYWTAKHLGDTGLEAMKQRGRVQVGKIADLTLFDPLTVGDSATYKPGENGLPSTGIPYVIVNGTIVVNDSKVLPVKAGQPIRFPNEAKSRFRPVEVNKWVGEHTINVQPMRQIDDTGAAVIEKRQGMSELHRHLAAMHARPGGRRSCTAADAGRYGFLNQHNE